MRTNVAFNGVGENVKPPVAASTSTAPGIEGAAGDIGGPGGNTAGEVISEEDDAARMQEAGRRPGCRGRVKVNEGDAWSAPVCAARLGNMETKLTVPVH
jgi:tRNA (guanine26-N2/guanine27-N2)-dimethyltransferase